MNNLKYIVNKLLDFIYKKKCYFCNSSKECTKMCSKCYKELLFSNYSPNRKINGITVYSAGTYEKYLQKMIRGIKYHNQKELAYYMAKFMWEYFNEIINKFELKNEYEIIPVPLHSKRERLRKYNHMKLVADELSNISGYSINNNLIKRVKATKPQYKLSYSEKIKNMENAFKVDMTKYTGKHLLIIDDICTSGATLSSIINELKANGIEDITCLCASSPI